MEWTTIENRLDRLIESGRHSELRGALSMLNEVDIAQYMRKLPGERLLMLFRVLPKDISAAVFSYMDVEQQQQLLGLIGDGEIRALIGDMFLDDAVDFLEELPANVVKRVLRSADPATRNLINRFLQYPENSAGSLMTIEFAEFHDRYTVAEAMDVLKRTSLDKENIFVSYVIDESRHLLGSVELKKLILARDEWRVTDIMDAPAISVRTLDDQEAVAHAMRKYGLLTIPVVDNEGRLVGIVTADDVMDVIEAENTEDFERMAAIIPSEDQYMRTGPVKLARHRLPWLMILMLSSTLIALLVTRYEDLLVRTGALGSALIACMPMLMDTGGNGGSQTSTLVIRSLALGQVHLRDALRVLWMELRIATVVGGVLAPVNCLWLILVRQIAPPVAVIVAISLFLTVLAAKAIGALLPLFAKLIHVDPAMIASPLLTSVVDAAALAVMFSIATAALPMLGGV